MIKIITRIINKNKYNIKDKRRVFFPGKILLPEDSILLPVSFMSNRNVMVRIPTDGQKLYGAVIYKSVIYILG